MSADITTATSHCISFPGPYATYILQASLRPPMVFHGRIGEPKTSNSHIRIGHRFLSYINFIHTQRRKCQPEWHKYIHYHHCRLSGQFGLSVDSNPYISSFFQYLVIYTATTTRNPTTQYIAFHTWRHQRRILLERTVITYDSQELKLK